MELHNQFYLLCSVKKINLIMDTRKKLLLLFNRPNEPIFMPKGEDNAVFVVPDYFLADRYQSIASQIRDDKSMKIQVPDIVIRPDNDMKMLMELDRQDNFSYFIPSHNALGIHLVKMFLNIGELEDLVTLAAYFRDRINAQLFNYALSVALLHRKDTVGIELPFFACCFPDKFIDSKYFHRIREEATAVPQKLRQPIEIP